MATTQWYKFGWFWDGSDQPPRQDQFIEIDSGRISAITPTSPGEYADISDAGFIPPLVNAHCHLEFSHLDAPLTPALPFSDWIGQTVAIRRNNADPVDSLRRGLCEVELSGTAFLGEIATHDLESYPLREAESYARPATWLFREFIAFDAQQAKTNLAQLKQFCSQIDSNYKMGISPHAPYTVCLDDLRDCVRFAGDFDLPVTMHLAETQAELELLEIGSGELVEMLDRLGLWDRNRYEKNLRPLDYLIQLAQAPRTLIAHGNYLAADEIDFLAENEQMSVVYCPRTHAFFKHPEHPWRKLLEMGVNVALGTDGRGSNPDLNVWNDVRFLVRKYPNFDPLLFLKMATTAGSAAFGIDSTLTVGTMALGTLLSSADPRAAKIHSASDLFTRKIECRSVILDPAFASLRNVPSPR